MHYEFCIKMQYTFNNLCFMPNIFFDNTRKGKAQFAHPIPSLPWMIGTVEPFFRRFIQEGLRSDWDFGWELVLQVEVMFFRWDQKTPCVKNSEYESQTSKMILTLISTIPHFWSPALTTYVSLYLYPYFPWYILPPPPTIFFSVGLKVFYISCSQGLGAGGPVFLFGRRGIRPFSSIKPLLTSHVNSRIVEGKICVF